MTPWDWSFDLDDDEAARRCSPPARRARCWSCTRRRKGHCDSAGDGTHFGSPALLRGDRREAAAARRLRPHPRVLGLRERDRRDADPQPRPDRHLDRALGPVESSGPKRAGLVLGDADPGRRRRQPQPRGRQRRPAGHRQGLRRRPDDGRPDRRRLLARPRRLGPLPRRGRRPLRPQDACWCWGWRCSIPASLLAAFAPSATVLFVARVLGGVAAGMAYPTTLALITALWSGSERTKAIALWSALGGGVSALGPLVAGALLEGFDWGSVFIVSAPLAAIALFCGLAPDPGPRQRDDRAGRPPRRHPLDRDGRDAGAGDQPGAGTGQGHDRDRPRRRRPRRRPPPSSCASAASSSRSTTSRSPPAAPSGSPPCAGIIVFGSLMGAMFIGQQFVQNVLGYSTLEAGLAILPGALRDDPRRAALGRSWSTSHGSRFTLLLGFVFCLLAFLEMLLLWDEGASYWVVGLGYLLVGIGRRLRRHPGLALADRLGAGDPGRHGLGHRRPPARPRRRDHAVDLRRPADRRLRRQLQPPRSPPRPKPTRSANSVQNELTKSFSSAANTAQQYPEYAPADRRRRPHLVPRRRRLDLRGRDDRDRPRHRRSSSSSSPSARRSWACSSATTAKTPQRPARLEDLTHPVGQVPSRAAR